MIKLLIGGSPCTFWSIAQKNGRETEASGMGWELFKNYLIAKQKFNPDFFLYENNKSAAQPIKDQISNELNCDLMHINSALVSAQTRERFYAFNWRVEQPKDRGIILRDILEPSPFEIAYELKTVGVGWRGRKGEDDKYHKRYESANEEKANALTTCQTDSMVAEPIRIGDIGSTAQAHRVYSCDGKSVTINSGGGGQGGKTGLYLCPVIGTPNPPFYEVRNGKIIISGVEYYINLADGVYCIRKLTPTECERLQTLPDGYTKAVSNAQRYRGLGNGWTAEIIIHILNGVLKDVPRDEEIVVLSMYDGIGTGRYCLDKMGFTNVRYFAYEIDKYAKQVAMSNYPDIIQLGDAFDLRHPDWTIGY
jgi:DNA (cytosine-5)-methyltransferase 3A